MGGLFVSAIIIAFLLASLIRAERRCDISLYSQIEIAFYCSVWMVWIGALIGAVGPSEPPAPFAAQPQTNPVSETALSARRAIAQRFSGATPSVPPAALAYAAPETGLEDLRGGTFDLLRGLDSWTAVYDISAHTVYLPDGTELEAHSGLGARLDNPQFVHERMRGATPPHVYELALREKPFHGVRALRLKPIGGYHVFGRDGLLAHSYMLGPKGDSNGCVVFKNYEAFLQAFQNGAVKRLVVVAHLD